MSNVSFFAKSCFCGRIFFSLFSLVLFILYHKCCKKKMAKIIPSPPFFFFFFQVFVFRCPSFPQSGVYSSSEIGSIFRLESVVDHRYQVLRAILSTPVRKKSFPLFFAHEKGLGHMFQKQFSCSPILFFCVATSQK